LPAAAATDATKPVLVRLGRPDVEHGNAKVPSASQPEECVAEQLARITSILEQHTKGLSSLQERLVVMASDMDKTMDGMLHQFSDFSGGVSDAMEYYDAMLTKSARAISMLKSTVGKSAVLASPALMDSTR
jgi:hypothetical protein